MTKLEARRLLRDVDAHFGEWRTQKCSRFVFGPLATATRCLDRPNARPSDLRLAGTAYAFAGDVYDFISAPRAAARAYRAALRCDPRDTWSWQELGSVLGQMGQDRAALRALRRAKCLDPEDEWLDFLITTTAESIRDGDAPRYENGRVGYLPAPSWDVCELLARNKPRQALQLLRRKRHPYLRQLRGRAYAALGNTSQLLAAWESIALTDGDVEIEQGDWFFLPDEVWDMPRFWRALHALRNRLVPGWSYMHDAMWEIVPEPKRYRWRSKAFKARHRRRMRLWLRYHIARTERDASKLSRLAHRYPNWPQATKLARKLGSTERTMSPLL